MILRRLLALVRQLLRQPVPQVDPYPEDEWRGAPHYERPPKEIAQ